MSLPTPYYDEGGVTLYHGDAREILPHVEADVLLTDPPYGIGYEANRRRVALPKSIRGDRDVSVRDDVLLWWSPRPALIFGSWKAPRPEGTRMVLVWDQGDALGMGDTSLPWKPCWQEIYVLGSGFRGRRTSSELRNSPPVQSLARNGRVHPNEKPIRLIQALLAKCPEGTVLDPFAGSGTTLVAAKNLGRRAIGIEIEERYCEVAAKRLGQGVLDFGVAS